MRPEIVKDTHLEFLDDLRESGIINMFGARPYIQDEFPELSKTEVEEVHNYWMESFGKEDR